MTTKPQVQAAAKALAKWHEGEACTTRKAAESSPADKPEHSVPLLLRRAQFHDDAAALLRSLATHPKAEPADGLTFQQRVDPWLIACFGETIARDQQERSHRFIEEALELVQACGCTASEAHQLVDYVYGRPVGERPQEVGGVMVTLAALCLAHGIDMHDAAEVELARIWTKVEAIRAKQAAKPKHSPLPEHAPKAEPAGVPEGWQLRVREDESQSWLEITGPQGQGCAFGVDRGSVRAEVLQEFNIAMLSAAPAAPQGKEADRG